MAVAKGATNQDAAASLFLSPKTVEFHLSNVYRKLGIERRAQLAYRLASEGPLVPSIDDGRLPKPGDLPDSTALGRR